MLIESDRDLFGKRQVLGVASGDLEVRPIPKDEADRIIKGGHYSRTVVWSSNLHLGVFLGEACIGALQFGPAMNPASGAKVVSGTAMDGWIELNRMWFDDGAKPKNCASRAISCAMRFIAKTRPAIQWVQSFADERCSKFGGVYQAANFAYCGSHTSTFYELDGEWFHKSMVGRGKDKRGWGNGPKIERLKAGFERATPHRFKQFRYIYFIDRRAMKRLLLEILPYPKPNQLARAA